MTPCTINDTPLTDQIFGLLMRMRFAGMVTDRTDPGSREESCQTRIKRQRSLSELKLERRLRSRRTLIRRRNRKLQRRQRREKLQQKPR